MGGLYSTQRWPRPHPVCCMCQTTEVPVMDPVCSSCKPAFVLVDEQTPAMGELRDQRVQIGPTDV